MLHTPALKPLMLIVCLVFMLASCSGQPDMAGKYQDVSHDASHSPSVIELRDNKEGTWETEIDLINFRWSVRDDEIWLHTKTGGVIIGQITDEGFKIELPDVGTYVFEKTTP